MKKDVSKIREWLRSVGAFDTETDEENEELCNDLNEMLSVC